MKRTFEVVFTLALALSCTCAWAQAPVRSTATPAQGAAAKTVSQTSTASLPSEAVVNAFIKKMFGYEESLTWKIVSIAPAAAPGLAEVNVLFNSPQGQQQARFFVTADGQHAIMGDLIPFGSDPFAATRQKLLASQTGLSRGPADAKLVLVEFADLECPGCKSAQSTMIRLQQDFPNARFVFQNYPLEQLHPWAMLAAKYVDCIGRNSNDKLVDFISGVFEQQASINEQNAEQKLKAYAEELRVNTPSLEPCLQSPDTYIRIQKSIDLGRTVGVTQTPTLFVNGRKVPQLVNVPYETVKQVVQFEADDAR